MPPTTSKRLQTHVSIATSDLHRSRAFYRALFDAEPALEKPDYVRFWPEELGLVVGLNLHAAPETRTGPLQHLGLLYAEAGQLAQTRRRLEAAGFATRGSEHVECCYAELDQFWATDPSGVEWELFLAHAAVVEPKQESSATAFCAPTCCS